MGLSCARASRRRTPSVARGVLLCMTRLAPTAMGAGVNGLRRQILDRPRLAACLLALALLMKLLTPSGYMFAASGGGFAVMPCAGMGPTATPGMAMPGMAHHSGDEHGERPDGPCAFAGLAGAPLGDGGPLIASTVPVADPGPPARLAAWPSRPSAAHLRPPATGPPRRA